MSKNLACSVAAVLYLVAMAFAGWIVGGVKSTPSPELQKLYSLDNGRR